MLITVFAAQANPVLWVQNGNIFPLQQVAAVAEKQEEFIQIKLPLHMYSSFIDHINGDQLYHDLIYMSAKAYGSWRFSGRIITMLRMVKKANGLGDFEGTSQSGLRFRYPIFSMPLGEVVASTRQCYQRWIWDITISSDSGLEVAKLTAAFLKT